MTSDAPFGTTPSQTVGPFFAYVLTPRDYGYPEIATAEVATSDAAGEPIRLEGRVFDEDGQPVPDAMVEIWQADGAGRYASGHDRGNSRFTGFGRCQCDPQGGYAFQTVKPGPTPFPAGGQQAPHVNFGLFARGLLKRLFTRIYFADENTNAADPILALVPEERRATLIARREDRGGQPVYVLDIHLRGEGETVFFEA
jgi:protocatechuate 3,4-dioxygenase alpha subunit